MATALTVVTAANYGDGVADVGFEAVDQPSSNEFANSGKTILVISNASGGNVTPTFNVLQGKHSANIVALVKTPVAAPIANGDTAAYGPFDPAIFGTLVQVNFDVGTSVTAAVLELEPTPI